MNQIFRISLFGHRHFSHYEALENHLYLILKKLMREKTFIEIYIGRNGDFDIYSATIVKRLQSEMGKDNNELVCVLPYIQKDINYYLEYYDNVIIPDCLEKTHPKGAITKRNKWMVEQSSLLICYIEKESGGAYTAFKYAKKLGKQIINLANQDNTYCDFGL